MRVATATIRWSDLIRIIADELVTHHRGAFRFVGWHLRLPDRRRRKTCCSNHYASAASLHGEIAIIEVYIMTATLLNYNCTSKKTAV